MATGTFSSHNARRLFYSHNVVEGKKVEFKVIKGQLEQPLRSKLWFEIGYFFKKVKIPVDTLGNCWVF